MIGKLVRAEIGRRVAKRMVGQNSGLAGVAVGIAAPWLARRAFTPVGFAVMGAVACKAAYDHYARAKPVVRAPVLRLPKPS